jgi:hypothetical protein
VFPEYLRASAAAALVASLPTRPRRRTIPVVFMLSPSWRPGDAGSLHTRSVLTRGQPSRASGHERPEAVTRPGGRHEARRPSRGPEAVTRPGGRHEARRPGGRHEARRPGGRHEARRPSRGPEARRPSRGPEAVTRPGGPEARRPSRGPEARRPSRGPEAVTRPGGPEAVTRPGGRHEARRPSRGPEARRPSRGPEAVTRPGGGRRLLGARTVGHGLRRGGPEGRQRGRRHAAAIAANTIKRSPCVYGERAAEALRGANKIAKV